MVKLTCRIPKKQAYSYIEIEKTVEDKDLDKELTNMGSLIDDNATSDIDEVIIIGKECPKCEKADVLAVKIGLSSKTNKPYYRVKCIDPKCDYLSWIDVKINNGKK